MAAMNESRGRPSSSEASTICAFDHERSPCLVFLKSQPVFDFLHREPRYQGLVEKVGLPLAP